MNYIKRIKVPQSYGDIEISLEDHKEYGNKVYLQLLMQERDNDYHYVNLTPDQAYQLSHELSIVATLATMNEEER